MSSKRHAFSVTLLLGSALSLIPAAVPACSVFQIGEGEDAVVGYSFDWFRPLEAAAFVNPRGRAKRSLAPGGDVPVDWTARYGSVTLSGFGREFPFAGMNEAGLVVAQAWLGRTVYPEIDSRPALSELQWIQYQLDTAATVQEVIASNERVRISSHTLAPLHFFVSDRSGDTAVIEFLDGKLVSSSGDDMPIQVMVNSPYRDCLAAPTQQAGQGACERFVVGADLIDAWRRDQHSPAEYAFATLDRLRSEATRWAVVFDRTNGQIHYRIAGVESFSGFDVGDLDYRCGNPDVQHILVDHRSAAATRFTAYEAPPVRAMILGNGANIPGSAPEVFVAMADYSDLAGCPVADDARSPSAG